MPTICADVIAKTRNSRESSRQSGSSERLSSAKYKDCVYHIITFPLLLCLLALQVWAHTALTVKGFQKKRKGGIKVFRGEPTARRLSSFTVLVLFLNQNIGGKSSVRIPGRVCGEWMETLVRQSSCCCCFYKCLFFSVINIKSTNKSPFRHKLFRRRLQVGSELRNGLGEQRVSGSVVFNNQQLIRWSSKSQKNVFIVWSHTDVKPSEAWTEMKRSRRVIKMNLFVWC